MNANIRTILDEDGFCQVIQGDKNIGTLRDFCCGVDFRPVNQRCLFSVLHIKKDNPKILGCIAEILQLDLDKLMGHYNYQHSDNRKQSFDEIKKGFEKYYER